jgi:murein DD-endopeptidase MepM/ murein hydrolase activator NlpD
MKRIFVRTAAALALCLALSACADHLPAPVSAWGRAAPPASGMVTVQRGDSVYDIARRYNLSSRDIIEANHLSPPYRLRAGDRLRLPAPAVYTVKAGDTVGGIARMNGVSAHELAGFNGLSAPFLIRPGQQLRLPGGHAAANNPPTRSRVQTAAVSPGPIPRPPHRAGAAQPAAAPVPMPAPAVTRVAATSASPVSSHGYVWPVTGTIVSGFGPKPGGLTNDGINILADRGTPVRAAGNGTVAYAGNQIRGFGNLVLLRHEDGLMTAYAHLDSIRVARGATVSRGAALGTVGTSGSVDRPQLHFEIRRGTTALDPRNYLTPSQLGSLSE